MTIARPLSRRAQFSGRQPISELMRLALARPDLISLAAGFVDQATLPVEATRQASEALLADYTRKGFFDGIGLRLPTICVRPGKPNKAASGFFSSIIREPLVGQEAILPVPRDVVHTHASPRSAVNFLIHAAGIDGSRVGPRRNLTMPGVGVMVQEQLDALRRVGGDMALSFIKEVPDDTIWAIVKGWPTRFEARRARDLGFEAERNFDEIIHAHIDDELGGKLPQ